MRSYNYPISFKDAFISVNLFSLSKYLPGKVWLVLGTANYLNKRYDFPSNKLVIISLNSQLFSIWVALVIGSIGMLLVDGFKIWGILVTGIWVCLTLILFFPEFHKIFEKTYNRIFKKNYQIPIITRKLLIKLIFPFALPWLLICLGFYIFIMSIDPSSINPVMSLGFPLASALGILAIISPGGIGVREGILTAYLALSGVELTLATTIAFSSRLWYLIAEIVIFLASYFLELKNKKLQKNSSAVNL